MNRRQMLQHLMLATIAATGTAPLQLHASEHGYYTIDPPLSPASTGESVDVIEFFWLGCPHCYALEPQIDRWLTGLPASVRFRREAPPLNPAWRTHAEAFYAAEALGVAEQVLTPMFHAIHRERRRLRKPRDIGEFMTEFDLDADRFVDTMKSFTVQSRLRQADILARQAGLDAVPAMVVDDRYRVTNTSSAAHGGMLAVVDRLIDQAQAARL